MPRQDFGAMELLPRDLTNYFNVHQPRMTCSYASLKSMKSLTCCHISYQEVKQKVYCSYSLLNKKFIAHVRFSKPSHSQIV
uniref:Uncharacterized protein n=1 Tax=Picea sitchensis TaxID=3332 RepID=D5AAR3_PICSI|nr:unknown [Picea sitchensis]